jgi:hypothetical protein
MNENLYDKTNNLNVKKIIIFNIDSFFINIKEILLYEKDINKR